MDREEPPPSESPSLDDLVDLDEDAEEPLAALDQANRHAVAILRDSLDELRGARVPAQGLSTAAARLREGLTSGHHPYGWLRAGAGFGVELPTWDEELLLAAVARTISPWEETGLDVEEESATLVMEHADWAGAVIGLCRAGPGARAEPEDLVRAIDDCPGIDGTTDPDDVVLTETAFELVLLPWEACGVVDDARRLTPLGHWILPRALARAWGGDFDADPEPEPAGLTGKTPRSVRRPPYLRPPMGRRSRARRRNLPAWGSVRLEPTAGSHLIVDVRGQDAASVPVGGLPAAHSLPGSSKWAVPALPATVEPLLDLLSAHPGIEVDEGALGALEDLDDLPDGTTGIVSLATLERTTFTLTVQPVSAPLIRDLLRLPGVAHDNRLERWVAPARPDAAAGLLDLLDRWPGIWADDRLLDVLDGLASSARARRGGSLGYSAAPPRPCQIRLDSRADGEFIVVCANCAGERVGEELDAVPGLLYDGFDDELLIPALPDSAPALRALLDRADGLDVADGVADRLAELEEARRRVDEMVALSGARDSSFAVAGLGGTLRPFQRAGVEYALRTRRTFLADEQGLGKTIQALAAVTAAGAFPAVVVCPASLKLNWQRETERWLPGRSVQVVGRRSQGATVEGAEVTIINYEQLASQEDALAGLGPRALVLDESHYCKSPKAKRTQAARRLASSIDPDGLVLALTGTPLLNRPMELLPQLDLLGRLRELGGYGRFITTFARGLDLDRLHRELRATCFVRRRKSEVLTQLPAKQRTVVPVDLDNRREYAQAEADVVAFLRERAALERRFLASLEGLPPEERAARIRARQDDVAERALRAEPLVRLTALKRLAAKGKLRAAVDWIHAFVESGEKLVVFAHHREVLAGLVAAFPDAAHILGSDEVADRQAAVERFQTDPGCQLMLCSQQAGGFGLTLTAASNVAFLELGWNPAVHDQAEDRCHRIGQSRQVTAWYLLAARTVDEPIAQLIEHKRAVVSAAADGETIDERASVLGDLVETLVAEGASGGGTRAPRAA